MSAPTPGIIFDLDGLLADTEPVWAESARRLLARRGLAWEPRLKARIMGRHPLEVARILADHYDLDEPPEVLFEERIALVHALYDEQPARPMPGALALVGALHGAGHPMAVASGSLTPLVDRVVSHLGVGPAMNACIGSDQVARGKPAPDIFLLAARRLDLPPERCFVLEDAAAGVEAALAAGMTCICVPSPETPPDAAARAHRVEASHEALGVADYRQTS